MEEKEIIEQIQNRFSVKRWQHILGVYKTAVELAEIFGADIKKAGQAALLHDYAKVLGKGEVITMAKEYGLIFDQADLLIPEVLHGPVGAKLVERDLEIKDTEILNSIARHTLGSEYMSKLDKIIFLADMIEPGRDYPGVDELRKTVYQDLDRGLLMGFDRTINYVETTGRLLHPQTVKSRQSLLKSI